jgi:hypothetical protein
MQTAKKSLNDTDLLPDYRLAQVFDFTAADLAANRNGFLSWGQRYGLGRRGQRWLGRLLPVYARLTRWLEPGYSEKVVILCGPVRLTQHFELSRRVMLGIYRLELDRPDKVRFVLTVAQYHALNDHIVYRVYYVPDPGGIFDQHILSIERADRDCSS